MEEAHTKPEAPPWTEMLAVDLCLSVHGPGRDCRALVYFESDGAESLDPDERHRMLELYSRFLVRCNYHSSADHKAPAAPVPTHGADDERQAIMLNLPCCRRKRRSQSGATRRSLQKLDSRYSSQVRSYTPL